MFLKNISVCLLLFVYMTVHIERAKRGKLMMHAAYITSGLHENSYALRNKNANMGTNIKLVYSFVILCCLLKFNYVPCLIQGHNY